MWRPILIIVAGMAALIVGFNFMAVQALKDQAPRPASPPPSAVVKTTKPAEISAREQAAKVATAAKETAAKEKEKKDDIARGLVAIGAQRLKAAMRDPDSFVLEQALMVEGTNAGCYTYRARNGFGGMNREYAVQSPDGAKLLINSMSGFDATWKKWCNGRRGTDLEAVINQRVLE